jgi:hypothetical protein
MDGQIVLAAEHPNLSYPLSESAAGAKPTMGKRQGNRIWILIGKKKKGFHRDRNRVARYHC